MSSSGGTLVAIADPAPLVLLGLKSTLRRIAGVEIGVEAHSSQDLLAGLRLSFCRLVVTEFDLPGGNDGFALLDRMRRWYPTTSIVVLTSISNPMVCQRMLDRGAWAVVHKSDPVEEVARVCRGALAWTGRGGASGQEPALRAQDEAPSIAVSSPLTHTELDVLRWLVRGLSITEIARKTHRSVSTIGTHKANLMRKLGLRNMMGLLQYGQEQGLSTEVTATDLLG